MAEEDTERVSVDPGQLTPQWQKPNPPYHNGWWALDEETEYSNGGFCFTENRRYPLALIKQYIELVERNGLE